MAKAPDAFRTISEVAKWLETQPHVLRYWESKFPEIQPTKRAGGRRYYRPEDMMLIGGIKQLLHRDGMTIKGVQKLIASEGVEHVKALSQPLDLLDPADLESAPSNVPKQKAEGANVIRFTIDPLPVRKKKPAKPKIAPPMEQPLLFPELETPPLEPAPPPLPVSPKPAPVGAITEKPSQPRGPDAPMLDLFDTPEDASMPLPLSAIVTPLHRPKLPKAVPSLNTFKAASSPVSALFAMDRGTRHLRAKALLDVIDEGPAPAPQSAG